MTKDNYKRTRLKDIAEIADVSVATVSIILKDP
ncbi:LacI family DNA-binding transcriptional regulator, partial [Erysipelothrix rhusiopathiae]|nr:LacI family DNA-binding transcriptional regulator [Erysipelothrix rhusiopathiae]